MANRRVLVKEVGKELELREIANTLQASQDIVGGYIECVRLPDDIDMWVNEEGLIIGLPLNLVTTVEGKIVHHIMGNIYFASHNDEGDTVSLSEGQIKWILERIIPVGTSEDGTLIHALMVR